MPVKYTDKQIKALLKEGKTGRHAIGNGLYFRISSEGTGFWVVRYTIHSKRKEMALGKYPELSLANAGAKAATLKANIKKGIDPLAEKKRPEQKKFKTIDDLAADWLEDCEKRLKHPHIPRRIYTKDISPYIGSLTFDQITPVDIREVINKIVERGAATVSNDALLYCKQLFRHGIKLNLMQFNPADAFTVNDAGGPEESRSRALSFDELKVVFDCFHENPDQFTRENLLAVALLLTLAVRKGELVPAKWEEFDIPNKKWDIPQSRSKTGVAISIPLSDEVIEWFRELHVRANGSEYVFPKRRASQRFGHMSPDTLNAAFGKLFSQKKLKVEYFTIHDLRRTSRSLLASLGVPGHIAERCLNHKLKGVEGIYDRYDYFNERRVALEKLAKVIEPIANSSQNSFIFN